MYKRQGLVCIVLWRMFDAWLALATGATVVLYMAYTLAVTEWRAKFRRLMNETDSEANTKACLLYTSRCV